jgi:signal transduction histidine kinase
MNRVLAFWRRSLSVQLLASMLLALFASQFIGLYISWEKFRTDIQLSARAELASRAEAVARLIESAPPGFEQEITQVSSTDQARFWISDEGADDLESWVEDAFHRFETPLSELLNGAAAQVAEQAPISSYATPIPEDATPALFTAGARWTGTGPVSGAPPDRVSRIDFADGAGAGVIVSLGSGPTLNAAYYKRMPSIWATHLPFSLALTAVLVALIGVLTVRRMTRPLRQLTRAAETLGRGEAVIPLRESGPQDIRRTAEAFNRMQERLSRFVADRTRMLGAIGHDLRTPLTTLRLRAELVEDSDLQERMLDTIDEMQAMTEATLSLARQENEVEETRTIDLSALVETVCEDLAELGQPVSFVAGERITYRCRPEGLRRTIRNLVENATRYAGAAEVSLVAGRSSVEILVDDNGPGIPQDVAEEVFAPFYRLEDSRSRETGGIGLGLSIARAIARQHGGDIILSSRDPGLRASVVLPV